LFVPKGWPKYKYRLDTLEDSDLFIVSDELGAETAQNNGTFFRVRHGTGHSGMKAEP
jgi:hypothetical protein